MLLVEDLAHGPVKYMGICRYVEELHNSKEEALPDTVPADFELKITGFEDGDGGMIALDCPQAN